MPGVERNERKARRRLPVGAEALDGGGVSFRVWAPKRRRVEVAFDDAAVPPLVLSADDDGYFEGESAAAAAAGTRYRFRLDGEDRLYPDPASRFQPDGPHGASQVVDPSSFKWTDAAWPGVGAHGQVLYEMHIGTFTAEGTWAAAAGKLPDLKDVGVTCLELMPINEFAGRWGWGYDGVDQFAPFHHYGSPDDARRFVDRAHALGLGVILDVVYNHFGPDGNYLRAFTDYYFSPTHVTDWGEALNFDGDGSAGVREFFLANVRHWIEEYHFDGFRFDATQAIVDHSPRHILCEITDAARLAAGKRSVYLVNENEPQHARLVRPVDRGGYGMCAIWNDDFHHAAMVTLTGHNEAYYMDYTGSPQELLSAAKYGFLFQGQRCKWQKKRRGTPALDLPPTAFVHFLQNHDQVANSARGYRAHHLSSPSQVRAMTALLMLMPQTPMLFQGQEWAASSPFLYFTDHNEELTKMICKGRAKEISQFPSAATFEPQGTLAHPGHPLTYEQSKLDHSEKEKPFHLAILKFHRDLIQLRLSDPTFARVQRRGQIDGAVLGPSALLLRFFGETHDGDRLLLVNLGNDLPLDPCPEPLLAPPLGTRWKQMLTSEAHEYGGTGSPAVDTEYEGWLLHGRCAVICGPAPAEDAAVQSRFRATGSAQEAKLKEERLAEQRKSEKQRTREG